METRAMRGGYREDATKMGQMAQAIHLASINDEYAARERAWVRGPALGLNSSGWLTAIALAAPPGPR